MPEQNSQAYSSSVHTGAPLPAEQPRSGAARGIIWVVLLGAFGLLFYFVLSHKPAPAGPPGGRGGFGPVTATVVTARKGNIGVYLDAIGTVTPVYTDSLTSQVTGLITAVNYREGQNVRKGEPLIQIDPRPYQANLETAEGSLQRDQNLLAEAQMDLKRYQDAWARNAIQKQTLDDQEKLVLQDQGTVKNDEGTVAYDKVQVEFCTIKAPIGGRVGLRLVDPGNVVTSGSSTVLAVITQIEPITVIFTMAEDSLPQVTAQMHQLRRGQHLQVDAYDRAMQHKIATGELETIDNQIDTATGTVKMRATFKNKDGALFPNQFVNTRLLVRTIENATLIPNSAIQHNGDQAFVYLVQPGKAPKTFTAKAVNITTGTVDGLNTAVQGIQPGDVVADSSFEKLQDGSTVNISKQAPPGSNGSAAESNAP